MTIQDLQKAAGGKIVFHSSWVGFTAILIIAALMYMGKMPLPAFASDVEKVSDKITLLTSEQLNTKLSVVTMQNRLHDLERYRDVNSEQIKSINRWLGKLDTGQVIIGSQISEVKTILLQQPRVKPQ